MKVERQVKVDGKQFEAKCQKCPSMLAFNRTIVGKRDQVTVTCGLLYPYCDLVPKKVKREK